MNRLTHAVLYTIQFLCFSVLFSQSQDQDIWSELVYNANTSYPAKYAVVTSAGESIIYTAKIYVPADSTGSNGPTGSNSSTYWQTTDETISSLTTSEAFVKAQTEINAIMAETNTTALANAVSALVDPESNSSDNSSFYGLAIRAYVGEFPVAGGIIISGSESKKVMVRVKGPSMNFSGIKLGNPKISITKQNSAGTYEAFLNSDDFGDHSSASAYPSYATGNTKEPAVVVDMDPGTYGVRVEDADGSQGNANVEFYEVDGDTSSSRFYGLALRAYVGQFPVAGGIIISGTATKKVMVRVKGPSMNFSGIKLGNPKISITKQNSAGIYETFLNSDDFGDHSSASAYPSYATGNTKEPAVVVDMEPGTYGVRVEDAGGSAGNANVEFYEVE